MELINVYGGLDPNSISADEHAKRYYESIRKQSNDCIRISENTGFTVEQVSLVKSHIFYTYHDLYKGFLRFDPSYEMASWRRLSSKKKSSIQSHDIVLLKHELLEIKYIMQGVSVTEAHKCASKTYNYNKCCAEFYKRFYKI